MNIVKTDDSFATIFTIEPSKVDPKISEFPWIKAKEVLPEYMHWAFNDSETLNHLQS